MLSGETISVQNCNKLTLVAMINLFQSSLFAALPGRLNSILFRRTGYPENKRTLRSLVFCYTFPRWVHGHLLFSLHHTKTTFTSKETTKYKFSEIGNDERRKSKARGKEDGYWWIRLIRITDHLKKNPCRLVSFNEVAVVFLYHTNLPLSQWKIQNRTSVK